MALELVEKIRRYIEQNSLIEAGDKVLAAVSAGLDSMVLLELLHRLSGPLEFTLSVAHFDHGLRGEQGAQECELVRRKCEALALPFQSGSAGRSLLEASYGENIQKAARIARYAFLHDCARKTGCSRIATGHHRDDQAETVLMRLIKGSGLVGLAGIQPSSCSGRLIRPLLAASRAELEEFAGENEIAWAEDPTNVTEKYLRNRLRHRLIPGIEKKYDPDFSENLVRLGEEAALFRRFLDDRTRELQQKGLAAVNEDAVEIDCNGAAEQPLLLRRHLIRQAVFDLTRGELILSGRPLNAVERLVSCGLSGKRLDLPRGLTAYREFDLVRITRKETSGGAKGGINGVELKAGNINVLRLGSRCWEIEIEMQKRQPGASLDLPEQGGGKNCYEERFDNNSLRWPLSAGQWVDGEQIRPFGLGGRKKLKKVLAEKRVPLSRRCEIPVVREAGREVLWVCGVCRSDLAPLGRETADVLVIRARLRQ